METVKDLIQEISGGLSQKSASRKDEIRVMGAMLSDPTYTVSIYGKNGPEGEYCPCEDFRGMCSSVISTVARVSTAEAQAMMDDYQVKKSEAGSMVNMSKEFINTYLATGRKINLGGRVDSDISLKQKDVPATTRTYPQKVGVNEDGSPRYAKNPTTIPAHKSIRVHAPCPSWVK